MTGVWFVVPVHGREQMTRVCLRQLRRTCDMARAYDVDATAVVIGEGPSLKVARSLGFATVRRDNRFLGRKFNDGYQLACDPRFNRGRRAEYCVPCGSDDWVDAAILRRLPHRHQIGVFRQLAIVNPERTELMRVHLGQPAGAGIRIIPRELLDLCGYRPADEDLRRGIDTSSLYGIYNANRRQMPELVPLDVHPLQIVDWKNSDVQLNSYRMLRGSRRGGTEDPFAALADVYPADALDEMRALEVAA